MAGVVAEAPGGAADPSLAEEAVSMHESLTGWLEVNRAALEAVSGMRGQAIETQVAEERELIRALDEAGWTRRGWPADAGGAGGTAISRAVLYDRLAAAGLPIPEAFVLLETLGPVLTRYAPDLARRHLPGILSGRTIWAQGFSEPDAGSDLAALRCRAEPSASGFVLRGQKTWTTLGHLADFALVLARTGEPGYRDLSAFWVDLADPHVTVRPITAANGRHEFAEMFFDEVVIPAGHLIGAIGQGWEIAMYLLQYERGMYAWLRQAVLHNRLATGVNLMNPADHDALRAVGSAFILLTALRRRSWATVEQLAADLSPGPEISVDKILLAQAEQAVHDAVRTIGAAAFLFDGGEEWSMRRDEWFYSRASSIFGGAIDVQRNIVADRVLKLSKSAR
jgi:acyl-CoA dehydrogenase